ncbi:poly(A)-specific ribonuclease PARN-like isoform X1 [Schistocerca piceifrons]|uniref:poly(A)-specific ribonuclease PARN-like isoform X1 n=1 Tax=Schistocerca piceifrons TaxID=274613 RepID=UPI001F5FBA26|nr:poly(A)-specific ribonuclease PARN-like isoform X1 [Schistocerca piceifrons]
MEVTKKNFAQILEELENVIPASEFLAIDGEFTGLNKGEEVTAFDTPALYYEKLRKGSSEFLIVQFGLCAFLYDEKRKKFTHKAYNFYVFPKPPDQRGTEKCFKSQVSSIHFLVENGFDFNKLYRDGIPYLRQDEEKRLREKLEEKHKASSSAKNCSNGDANDVIPVPADKAEFIEDMCTRIKNFLSEEGKEELTLEGCNGFVRKLMYQEVSERFRGVRLETRKAAGGDRILVASRLGTNEEEQQRLKDLQLAEIQDLDSAVGFSRVIRMLSQSGKLLIGHNMLLDICLIINQFCTELPESYLEFKQIVSFLFPRLLDTKYMSFCEPFKSLVSSTVLGHLQKTLSEPPFESIKADPAEDGYGYSADSDKYHEAGYDAYVTGLCFLTMVQHLGLKLTSEKLLLSASPLLKPFFNRLYLMRVLDHPFISIDENEPELPRDHVFHVTFPKEWKTHDVIQLFSPFGRVFVSWLNDTSAYVSLENRDQAKLVLRTLTQSDTYRVIPYKRHQMLKQPSPPSKKQQTKPSMKRLRTEKDMVTGKGGIGTIPEEDEELEVPNQGMLRNSVTRGKLKDYDLMRPPPDSLQTQPSAR